MKSSHLGAKKPKVTAEFPVDHFSASSMILFSTNPILYKIRYINRDVFNTTMGISGVLGRAFHNAMEVYYGGSDTIIVSNESEAIEAGLKVGAEYISTYNDGFIEYSATIPNKQKAIELFTFCFNSYIKESEYKTGVIATEDKIIEKINVEWGKKKLNIPVKLKGYIDRIDEEDGKLKIIDYKTCYSFSNLEKIDGAKILQAVEYYLLAYAKYGKEPYSLTYEEIKYTQNRDKSPQVRRYEIVYADNELYFDFYFRFYEDMVKALNGEMVFVPNVHTMFDNEVSIVSYIHRLDIEEETAKLMQKFKVENISELLKKKIQNAGNMRKLLKSIEDKFVSAKNIDYEKMIMEEKIQTKLLEYGIILSFDSKIEGATVDQYRYVPSIGVKMSRIKSFTEDVEQVTGISGIRVLAPIPNTSLVGFEVPKAERVFKELPKVSKNFNLSIGETITGEVRKFDLRDAPHMLVAGSSGSGKSVFLHSIIRQLIQVKNVDLHLFDPKQIELAQYEEDVEEYRHSADGISTALQGLVSEMEKRYTMMKKLKVKHISETSMKYKVVIIDEYADLKMRSEVDNNIKLLTQKGRSCGIHVVIATQRASTKVIDGDTKSNFPVKVVFRMSKEIDSRVMIDEAGAEKLLGKGDCLFVGEWGVERLQAYKI